MGLFLKKWAKYSVRLCLVIGFHYLCIKFAKMMEKAQQVIDYMLSMRNERQREVLMRFFKTAPGEYGEGDEFLGLKVPQTRAVVAEAKDLPLDEVRSLSYKQPELVANRSKEHYLFESSIPLEPGDYLRKRI